MRHAPCSEIDRASYDKWGHPAGLHSPFHRLRLFQECILHATQWYQILVVSKLMIIYNRMSDVSQKINNKQSSQTDESLEKETNSRLTFSLSFEEVTVDKSRLKSVLGMRFLERDDDNIVTIYCALHQFKKISFDNNPTK